ncbi:MAG: glycine zipper domain-containing protein [Pseudorhodoplanes sp.]|uniref:YMGG-like glycine zipper-containing protein n=1 Tax=Pseudorhodoplanes sp. TaxID=1934341 RepID=UPI003D117B9F
MRRMLFAAAASAALFAVPANGHAQDAAAGAATGAAIGAGVGAVVGGPVGAAIGAGVGGTVGAGAGDTNRSRVEDRVIVEERGPMVRQRNCTTNAAGTTICEEIRR